MREFSPLTLLARLRSLGVAEHASLCVAFSGGLDSTVLLHALAQTRAFELRAAHIDHQLQPRSAEWRGRCEAIAAQLGVPLVSSVVNVDPAGEGREAAARRVRYDAFRSLLRPGEILLTAHHADDQLETMLLSLMRGAGVRGLGGAAANQPFGAGRLVRPLLEFTRAHLASWAREQGLEWIDDPSNLDTRLDRNFLRTHIAPLLHERWPAAATSAARSAVHLQQADETLRALAEADLAPLRAGDCLDVVRLSALDPARRRNALRHWIRGRGARLPSMRKLAAIEHDMLAAAPDRIPCIGWDDVELRRYRGLLHLDRRLPDIDVEALSWTSSAVLELPGQLGSLALIRDAAGALSRQRLAPTLCVRFRDGGERIRPTGQVHRRSLKKMLQAADVPPWRRARLPLIYSDDRLAAVGDLWAAEEFAARDAEDAVRIVWTKGSG